MQSVAYTFLYIRCEALYYLNGENAWGSKLFDTPSYNDTGILHVSHTPTIRILAQAVLKILCWQDFSTVIMAKAHNSSKTQSIIFRSWKYNWKFSSKFLENCKRSCGDKIVSTDGLMDGRRDGRTHYYSPLRLTSGTKTDILLNSVLLKS